MQTGGGGEGGGAGGVGSYRTLRSRHETPSIADINVTPLVDVVLVLLIIFMVTAPMMSRGIDVNLPVATQTENPPEDRLMISINAEGRVYLSDKPINRVLLEQTLRDYLASSRSDSHTSRPTRRRLDERRGRSADRRARGDGPRHGRRLRAVRHGTHPL